MRTIAAFSLLLSAFLVVRAAAQVPVHAPDGDSGANFIASIVIPAFEHAPFSATVTTEDTVLLAIGATAVTTNRRLVARDGLGRIFQERRTFVPIGSPGESQVTQTEISDPATRSVTVCYPSRHVCEIRGYRPVTTWTLPEPGTSADGRTAMVRQNLGRQMADGLELIGTREVLTLVSGSESVQVTRDLWYSPQLGINVTTDRSDPRVHRVERFTVSDIAVGEPDPVLFSPPSGDRLVDVRPDKPPATR